MHALLLETGWEGEKISRSIFDAAWGNVGVVGDSLRNHIATGEALGLWARSDGGTRRGTIRVLPTTSRQDLPSVSPATA